MHWTKLHKINKNIKRNILFYLQPHKKPKLPCRITLTRIAPRELDFDNLAYALKKCTDVVADWLLPGLAAGRADGDDRLKFELTQRKGSPKEYALEIKIQSM